jgi:predicted pyridoxine 5'-phosphate oxidase superfamily flavin-nucleotide-binding protein
MQPAVETGVFHEGELALQSRTGAREQLASRSAKLIRDAMPDQHREFFSQLPFVLTGSVDSAGQPWASLLANPPGFMRSPDPGKLVIAALPPATDPLGNALVPGADIALLGIEQHTRRRNRANGVVTAVDDAGFAVAIKQSFGNCAKYIQARQAEYWQRDASPHTDHATALNQACQRIVERADTFFIASAHPQANTRSVAAHGVDVSHRGGKPGFVQIADRHTLVVPDFSGNRFFNTLGNLSLNPRAGLLFIDFESGGLLQIAVTAEIVFEGPTLHAFAGAERLLRFTITHLQHTCNAAPLRWNSEVQLSPFLQQTGSW